MSWHFLNFSRLYISGYAYPVTLDDTTNLNFDTVYFHNFAEAVRLGSNCDVVTFEKCAWGSENNTPTAFQNSAICINHGAYTSPITGTLGGGNGIVVRDSWVMRLGTFFKQVKAASPVKFDNVYFEAVARYYHAAPSGTVGGFMLTMDNCNGSLPAANTLGTDPLVAGYGAKVHFDGVVATGAGAQGNINIRNFNQEQADSNAFISIVSYATVNWSNNTITPSTTFGHIRNVRTGYEVYRKIMDITETNVNTGSFTFGEKNTMRKTSGPVIHQTATVGSGATYTLHHVKGDQYNLTLPNGDCTIDSIEYGSQPQHVTTPGIEITVLLIVPASVTATRTITFGARLKLASAGTTITYTATEQNKVLILKFVSISETSRVYAQSNSNATFV